MQVLFELAAMVWLLGPEIVVVLLVLAAFSD
jgi:hypothetical protein